MPLKIRKADINTYDCVALGEVMLRLDPEENRICRTDRFRVWEGGGEYNVVQGLSSCFNSRTAILTSLVDNEVGQLVSSLIKRAGVDTRYIKWLDFDGMGHKARNGLYFMERGYGDRGAKAVMDRGHTAISQLTVNDIDWDSVFSEAQPRWFHVGGVMVGLSEQAPDVVLAAITAAKKYGAIISYDLNYRDSLWRERGGREAAKACNDLILPLVDVLFGIEGLPKNINSLDVDAFSTTMKSMQEQYPNLKHIVSTMRIVNDASHNDWGGLCLVEGEIYVAKERLRLPIFDRVGGGDAFAAGYIHGLLTDQGIQKAIDFAVAHGALVMSTAGDNSMVSQEEVYAYAGGGDASANR